MERKLQQRKRDQHDLEIAGEAGRRPGARQFTNAVEANAERALVDDTEGLPGYGLQREDRG